MNFPIFCLPLFLLNKGLFATFFIFRSHKY